MATQASQNSELISYKTDEVICQQGRVIDALYRLEQGTVRVVILPTQGGVPITRKVLSEGKIIGTLSQKGAILGEPSSVMSRFSASIVAASRVQATRIPITGRDLITTIRNRPQLGLSLAVSLARRVHDVYEALHLSGQYITRVQNDIDGHCMDFMQTVDQIPVIGKSDVEARRMYQRARKSFSYRRGLRLTEERAKAQGIVSDILASGMGKSVIVQPGELLFREGDEAEFMYVIKKGTLEILVDNRRVDVVREGEVIGEVSVLVPDKRLHTVGVRGMSEANVVTIASSELENTITTHPALIIHIGQVLSRRLEAANEAMFSFDRHMRLLLGNLSGGKESCDRDHQNLAEEMTSAGEKFDNMVEDMFEKLAGIRNQHNQVEKEISDDKQATRMGISYGELRAHGQFAALEQKVASLLARFYDVEDHGLVSYDNLMALMREIVQHYRVGARIHLQPERPGTLSCHSLAVALLAIEISMAARRPDHECLLTGAGALLHDIGMIIPEGSNEPFEIEQHPIRYSDMHLKKFDHVPSAIREMLHQHEEFMDGSGYPGGLSGASLSIPVRIIHLANAFDLCIASGLSPKEAIAQLMLEQAKFDPMLTATFEDIINTTSGTVDMED